MTLCDVRYYKIIPNELLVIVSEIDPLTAKDRANMSRASLAFNGLFQSQLNIEKLNRLLWFVAAGEQDNAQKN
ncbi:hypothetical protein [Legionella sp.]|uniref:hypothetical protein n=1 Tax=Legionella sp. TaxID=459 RepID=UPI003CB72490